MKKLLSNKNLRNKIFAAIASVAVFCVMVVVIIATRKTEAVADSVVINGKEYSSTNKMKILEIVPDKLYDEFGAIIGNAYGALAWDDIMAKLPSDKKILKEKDIYKAMYGYSNFVNGVMLTGTNYCVAIKYDNKYYINVNKLFESQGWPDSIDGSKVELKFCTYSKGKDGQIVVDGPLMVEEKQPDGSLANVEVRDAFSYFVFGNTSMEGKVELVIKTPKELNEDSKKAKELIDESALVMFSSKNHNDGLFEAYDLINGTNKKSTLDKSMKWTLGSNDLSADLALYIYMLNSTKGKAVIYNSEDKSAGSDGKFSNISRICLAMSGIDRDTMVSDFAINEVTTNAELATGMRYKGNYGYIRIEKDNDNGGGKEVINFYSADGTSKAPVNTNGQFSYWENYQRYLRGSSYTDKSGENYPTYNATSGNHSQAYIDKYVWAFNSDNAITSQLISSNIYPSNAEDLDANWGTNYSDAKKETSHNKTTSVDLSGARVIQYIIGAFKTVPDSDINVLEIQPIGFYKYNTDDGEKKIKTWFGLPENFKVKVNVTSVSVNAFDGLNQDIIATYDLIIIGSQGKDQTNTDIYGSTMYADSDKRKFTASSKSYTLNDIDLTDKAYDKLVAYAKKGLPIAMEYDIYYGSTAVVDKDCNMYKMRMASLRATLGSQHPNVVSINKDQEVSDAINYQKKPSITIQPVGMTEYEYKGEDTVTNDRSKLKSLQFKGTVNLPNDSRTAGGKYKVKIYIDRNCDSIFSEDRTSDDTELFYSASDGTGVECTSSGFECNLTLPSGLTGYVGWKVEVTDEYTGLTSINTGAFALKYETRKTIYVVQIIHDSVTGSDGKEKYPEHLDLSAGSKFAEKFDAVSDITGFDLDVTTLTKSEFSQAIYENPDFLDDYTMVVMGFADDYGNDSDADGYDYDPTTSPAKKSLSKQAIEAIKSYIEEGKSVLMTHDTMSYKDSSGSPAGQKSKLNMATKTFKPLIGMKDDYYITDTLVYKLSAKSPYNDITDYPSYGKEHNSSTTRTTTKISRLNEGEVTSYPYSINTDIAVAQTHGQYFALNLEQINTTLDGREKDNSVVVWYTLSDPDGAVAGDKYFTYSGQDAVNNYYMYSAGNVTYTSAGHSDMDEATDNDAEMELFVNTFVRAILAGNSAPDIIYTDAVYDDSISAYKGYFKYNYSKYAKRKLGFTFKINDADLIDGKGIIKETFMYVYNEDGHTNKDGKFDESCGDIMLGYINVNSSGTVSALTPMNPTSNLKIVAGKEYAVEDLWSLVGDKAETLKSQMVDGNLKIGIQATDGHKGKGYAILDLQAKDLFDMD